MHSDRKSSARPRESGWWSPVAAQILVLAVLLVLAACAQPGQESEGEPPAEEETSDGGAAEPAEEDFDLDALIAAAQAEGELTVYNPSGSIVDVGEAFEAEYGIVVHGTKAGSAEQSEIVIREVDSGNIQTSAIQIEDGAMVEAHLLAGDYVYSWVPPDMAAEIPPQYQGTLSHFWQPRIFGYNTEVYGDTCPISNIWELTEDEWSGKFAMRDPQGTPEQLNWFSQLVTVEEADALEAAYEDHYGEPLETDEENAGYEWIKRLAQNSPIVMPSDGDVGDAVGAAGQSDPPMGMYTLGKHRDIVEADLKLGLCDTLGQFQGYVFPTYALIVRDAPAPNAAKLFTRYLLTEAGVGPWVKDRIGGYSTHPGVTPNEDNPVGSLAEWEERAVFLDAENNLNAWNQRQDLQDFWLVNLSG